MPFGTLAKVPKPDWVKMRWLTEAEKLLGAYVGVDLTNEKEFAKAISNLEKAVSNWGAIQCGIHGRALVHNMALIPKVFYTATMTAVTEVTFKKIHDLLWKEYLWKGKQAKMNQRLATLPKKYSSLAVVDFETKVQASRVMTMKALLSPEGKGDWKTWAWHRISRILKAKGLTNESSTIAFQNCRWDLNDFWQSCLAAWNKAGGCYNNGEMGLRGETQDQWITLNEITAKKVYTIFQSRKTKVLSNQLGEEWKEFALEESSWVIKSTLTSPEVKEFFTLLRHGNVYTKDRLFHIPFLKIEDQVCEACGIAKETTQHFLFDCQEAILFWAHIEKIFPEYHNRSDKERLLFVKKGTKPREKVQCLRDDAVATAIHMRWRERAKASTSKDYDYDPDAAWAKWGNEMYLKHHHGNATPTFLFPLPLPEKREPRLGPIAFDPKPAGADQSEEGESRESMDNEPDTEVLPENARASAQHFFW
jgi:hypothetical protein